MRIALAFALLAGPTFANDFETIRDKDQFLTLIAGKELRIGLYNLTLKVDPEGSISGDAMGWKIVGDWSWQDGYFCREMDWEGYSVPFNCQLVERRGDQELRFTVDKGQGSSATFKLR